MPRHTCKIWPDVPAESITRVTDDDEPTLLVKGSMRTSVDYIIEQHVANWCKMYEDEQSPRVKARLTTWLITHPIGPDGPTRIRAHHIPMMWERTDLPIHNRCERLLHKIASFQKPSVSIHPRSKSYPQLLAWSESIDEWDLDDILAILQYDGLVQQDRTRVSVTDKGRSQSEKSNPNANNMIWF